MWREKQAELLNEIEVVLASIANTPGLHDLTKEILAKIQGGLLVASTVYRPWSLLPLIVCETICGKYKHALPAAAGLQLLRASAEVFDDVEDADSSTSLSAKYGSAIAINVATSLLILAERALTRLKLNGIDDCTIIRVIDTINSHYTVACAGQHLDLSLKTGTTISEDVYFNVIEMKSASTLECSCRVGALLARANQQLTDTFGQFGHNLGIAAQIADDILDITEKNNFVGCKLTLPIIYALAQTRGQKRRQLKQALLQSYTAASKSDKIREILFSSGAIQYATIKMELYKQLALDNLFSIRKEVSCAEQLKQFLE